MIVGLIGVSVQFEYTEPEQNVFNFTGGDYFLDLAEATDKLVRCHNLIWSSQLPTWVTNPPKNWTKPQLSAILKNHVTKLVEHWGDRCYSWDVVNEALSDDPAGSYVSNIWYDTIGKDYVPMAFAAAQEAVKKNGLKVKLYYNDYNIEYPGAKSTAAQNIVKELQSQNIQIDGVGLESHFIVGMYYPSPFTIAGWSLISATGETPSLHSQTINKKAFTKLGVDVAITELDIRMNLPPNVTTETQQVLDYYNSVKSCTNVKRCIGVTQWDFDDTYSWIPSTFPGQGYADLFTQPGGADHPLVRNSSVYCEVRHY